MITPECLDICQRQAPRWMKVMTNRPCDEPVGGTTLLPLDCCAASIPIRAMRKPIGWFNEYSASRWSGEWFLLTWRNRGIRDQTSLSGTEPYSSRHVAKGDWEAIGCLECFGFARRKTKEYSGYLLNYSSVWGRGADTSNRQVISQACLTQKSCATYVILRMNREYFRVASELM